ncbi:Aldo reductase [Aspergillus mulundensis]|uniref:Aldo reductase n=1 Tax=Aspergillus mulundensis TaxID=1810919 RepID=A0A3D8T5N5_9EURO|nr:Aldo reductase [Aspergillus mulundensis]RDW93834.1 Aldo reductase [Aspergillus mulundensis]
MASLAALKVPRVHVWYLHSPDRTVPFEETLREVNKLYEEGYFAKLGISNDQSWEVATLCEICHRNGWVKPSVCQGIYNAFHRAVEPELLRCLRHHGIAFYCFNPLAAGMLTGRCSRGEPDAVEAGTRFRPGVSVGGSYPEALLRPLAKRHGVSEVECALRWLSHHSELKEELGDGVVLGSSSVKQLDENLRAMAGGPLPDEIVDVLDRAWEIIQGKQLIYWH